MIYIDTNVFLSVLFSNKHSARAFEILSTSVEPVTSQTVINESLYLIARNEAEKLGIKGVYDFKRYVEKSGLSFAKQSFETFFSLLDDAGVEIIEEPQDPKKLMKLMLTYSLLPNDAQIALTCWENNIEDGAFENVSFLSVVR